MAFTQADATAIETAIATGAMKVRYPDGSEVSYRTLEEMERILARIERAIGATPSTCRTSVAGF